MRDEVIVDLASSMCGRFGLYEDPASGADACCLDGGLADTDQVGNHNPATPKRIECNHPQP
jgi:predicted PhzF superfamily epimerase YddE/YHI9